MAQRGRQHLALVHSATPPGLDSHARRSAAMAGLLTAIINLSNVQAVKARHEVR